MKYKTLVRLAVKLLGLFLAASAIPDLVSMGVGVLLEIWTIRGGYGWWVLGSVLGSATQFLIGLYLFAGGRWLVDRLIPSNRPYCHECAYELTGLPSEGVCPECGTPYRWKGVGGTRH